MQLSKNQIHTVEACVEVSMIEAAKMTVPESGAAAVSKTHSLLRSCSLGLEEETRATKPSEEFLKESMSFRRRNSEIDWVERARVVNFIVGDADAFRQLQSQIRRSSVVTDGATREVVEKLVKEKIEEQKAVMQKWLERHRAKAPACAGGEESKAETKKDIWTTCKASIGGILTKAQEQDDGVSTFYATGWNKKKASATPLQVPNGKPRVRVALGA